jgi:dihydrofolate synthase/folylpolyglutamate synthase
VYQNLVRGANEDHDRIAACQSVEDALRFLAARDRLAPPRILITGSLYMAGAVLAANGAVLS